MSNKGGRPTKYKEEYKEQAFKLSLLGSTDAEISDFFEVSESTLNLWKIEHPEFSESIREGKIKADSFVANKLYDKALGAEWIEDQPFKVKRIEYQNGKKHQEYEEVITIAVKRSIPPDTQAISLWLRNRQSSKWKDKVEAVHSGNLVIAWEE